MQRNVLIRSKAHPYRIDLLTLAALAVALLPPCAGAFSLLGPYEAWMTPQIGFQLSGDIGGPMNLNQEYRWNVPVLTYAFDPSFTAYFGSNGIAAVEAAISILNDLPPASQVNPSNFPPTTTRVNYAAAAQRLFDLKSQTLATLVEELGLASPTRFTFALRSVSTNNGELQGMVVQRNFDPVTAAPISNVNDTVYSYTLQPISTPHGVGVDAVEFPVDSQSPVSTAVADAALVRGVFYTGLTRDDVGGLAYLLRTNNLNLERLLPDVHGADTNAAAYAIEALRGGVNHITFVPHDYDSLIGQFFSPFTNRYTDTYITNGTVYQQQVERVITQPDVVFGVGDFNTADMPPTRVVRTDTINWFSLPDAVPGPGVIRPQVEITFVKPKPSVQTSDSQPDALSQVIDYCWASFDGSTNAPLAYPVNFTPADTNHLTVNLSLHDNTSAILATFTWHAPVALGNGVRLQGSTNLVDWVSLATVTNHGLPVDWNHSCTQAARFFRAIPE